jgi:hypothetical protein
MYRLDRSAFKIQTLEEADNTRAYWLTQSLEERLRAAMYLNSIVYGFDPENPPRMDRSSFSEKNEIVNNIFNKDFRDFIEVLNRNKVEYVLVGGYSVILHGYLRNTGDMDIWVNKTKDNYQKLVFAFRDFGMPVFDMTETAFLDRPDLDVFTFGRPPASIDLMTAVKGLDFDEVIKQAEWREIDGLKVRIISLPHLLKAKKASNRPKDQDDIAHLS